MLAQRLSPCVVGSRWPACLLRADGNHNNGFEQVVERRSMEVGIHLNLLVMRNRGAVHICLYSRQFTTVRMEPTRDAHRAGRGETPRVKQLKTGCAWGILLAVLVGRNR